jgi:hypothetical protein
MKNKDEIYYNKCNTPIITHMMNLMQFVYGDEHVRGSHDEAIINGETKQVAPLFSALQAFILTTAICMRGPGQQFIDANITNEEILDKSAKVMLALEEMLCEQPVKANLLTSIEKFVMNGNFKRQTATDTEAEILLRGKNN